MRSNRSYLKTRIKMKMVIAILKLTQANQNTLKDILSMKIIRMQLINMMKI